MVYIKEFGEKPAGTNEDSLREAFRQKEMYEEMVVTFPWEPDFLSTRANIRSLYGKVDEKGFSVVPRVKRLTQVAASKDETYYLLDIVAASFEKMKDHYDRLILQGKIDATDPFLGKLEIHNACVNNIDKYNSYLKKQTEYFNRQFVKTDSEIPDYKSHEMKMRDYVDFLTSNSKPFTMSEYVVSRMNFPTQTGLALQVAAEDASEDGMKYANFYESVNFPIFQKVAYRYGFRVDKNCPWTLYYDISSPYAIKEQSSQGIYTLTEFFNRFYVKVFDFEVDTLVEKMSSLYDIYREYDSEYTHMICQNKSVKKMREVVTPAVLRQRYDMSHWIRLYAYIRATETFKKWNQQTFDRIVREVIAVHTYRSEHQAIAMLESNFTDRTTELFHKNGLTKANVFDSIVSSKRATFKF